MQEAEGQIGALVTAVMRRSAEKFGETPHPANNGPTMTHRIPARHGPFVAEPHANTRRKDRTFMAERVCPWWMGRLLLNPLRRWRLKPERLLGPYVHEGMTVLEPGPGMGFFTVPLARMVGATGHVIALDLQTRMLDGLRKRVTRQGLAERVEMRLTGRDSMRIGDLAGIVDFVLAFAVVHEMPSAERFFRETALVLRPGASLLLVEPAGHVSTAKFDRELEAAHAAGMVDAEAPAVPGNHTALLRKPAA